MSNEKYTQEGLPIIKKDLLQAIWAEEDRDFGLPEQISLDKLEGDVKQKLTQSLIDAYQRGYREAYHQEKNKVLFEELEKRVRQIAEDRVKFIAENRVKFIAEKIISLQKADLPIEMYKEAFLDGVRETYKILRTQAEANQLEREVKGE